MGGGRDLKKGEQCFIFQKFLTTGMWPHTFIIGINAVFHRGHDKPPILLPEVDSKGEGPDHALQYRVFPHLLPYPVGVYQDFRWNCNRFIHCQHTQRFCKINAYFQNFQCCQYCFCCIKNKDGWLDTLVLFCRTPLHNYYCVCICSCLWDCVYL